MLLGLLAISAMLTTKAQAAESAAVSPEAASPAPANESIGVPERSAARLGAEDHTPADLLWQSLAAVLVILALGGAALFVVRRLMPRIAAARGKQIHVIESLSLGPNKAIYLVGVGQRRLLLAAGRDQVCLLDDVSDAVATSPDARADPPRGRFTVQEPTSETERPS